jgi:hypothetical protein
MDLAVRGVDADLKCPDPHGAALGHLANVRVGLIRQPGLGDIALVDAVFLTWQDGNGFHPGTRHDKR